MSFNNQTYNKPLYFLNPGDVYVCSTDCIIETVLGSCVAVAFWDPYLKVGGMNHIVLSKSKNETQFMSTRFAEHAMETLANEMRKFQSKPTHWKTFIVGGSQQFKNAHYNVGNDNVLAVKNWLDSKNIPIQLIDVGGSQGRLVKFEPIVGKIRIINLKNNLGKK